MAFAVVAYPVLDNKDYKFIQDYRRLNDPFLYSVIEPHFTLVFPVMNINADDFIAEIIKQSVSHNSFNFIIRCAVVNKDSFLDYSHTLLVPDDGFSNIVKLHDKLYEGILLEERRLDIDYIPHIGIGTSKDIYDCKRMANELNDLQLEICGSIDKLTIVKFEDNKIENLYVI